VSKTSAYLQILNDFYRPGRIVPSYGGGYDRVIELVIPDAYTGANWHVIVQAVRPAIPIYSPRSTDEWTIDLNYPRPRCHCTYPTNRQIVEAYIINQDHPDRRAS
jgi:hypothetical protein